MCHQLVRAGKGWSAALGRQCAGGEGSHERACTCISGLPLEWQCRYACTGGRVQLSLGNGRGRGEGYMGMNMHCVCTCASSCPLHGGSKRGIWKDMIAEAQNRVGHSPSQYLLSSAGTPSFRAAQLRAAHKPLVRPAAQPVPQAQHRAGHRLCRLCRSRAASEQAFTTAR